MEAAETVAVQDRQSGSIVCKVDGNNFPPNSVLISMLTIMSFFYKLVHMYLVKVIVLCAVAVCSLLFALHVTT